MSFLLSQRLVMVRKESMVTRKGPEGKTTNQTDVNSSSSKSRKLENHHDGSMSLNRRIVTTIPAGTGDAIRGFSMSYELHCSKRVFRLPHIFTYLILLINPAYSSQNIRLQIAFKALFRRGEKNTHTQIIKLEERNILYTDKPVFYLF